MQMLAEPWCDSRGMHATSNDCAGYVCAFLTNPMHVCQFAAVMNEKKAKLRQLRDRIQELEQQAEEGADLVCP